MDTHHPNIIEAMVQKENAEPIVESPRVMAFAVYRRLRDVRAILSRIQIDEIEMLVAEEELFYIGLLNSGIIGRAEYDDLRNELNAPIVMEDRAA